MKLVDLSGQRFGKLTVIDRAPNKNGRTMWSCICDCGKRSVVSAEHLKDGHTTSCGCSKADNASELFSTHRMTDTPLYRMWRNMLNRCYFEKSDHYQQYGGRGITVCDEWKSDFISFCQWAINNGYVEGLSIERNDVNGNYCPNNCRFIPVSEQAANKQNTRYLEYNGRKIPLYKAAEEFGINRSTIIARIDRHGWSVEKALTTPVRQIHRKAG